MVWEWLSGDLRLAVCEAFNFHWNYSYHERILYCLNAIFFFFFFFWRLKGLQLMLMLGQEAKAGWADAGGGGHLIISCHTASPIRSLKG